MKYICRYCISLLLSIAATQLWQQPSCSGATSSCSSAVASPRLQYCRTLCSVGGHTARNGRWIGGRDACLTLFTGGSSMFCSAAAGHQPVGRQPIGEGPKLECGPRLGTLYPAVISYGGLPVVRRALCVSWKWFLYVTVRILQKKHSFECFSENSSYIFFFLRLLLHNQ